VLWASSAPEGEQERISMRVRTALQKGFCRRASNAKSRLIDDGTDMADVSKVVKAELTIAVGGRARNSTATKYNTGS